MASSTYTYRLDSDLRKQSERIFQSLGMNMGTAINVFLRQAVKVGGFPFDVRLDKPNLETIEAMLEAERIAVDPQIKGYTVDEAFEELEKD